MQNDPTARKDNVRRTLRVTPTLAREWMSTRNRLSHRRVAWAARNTIRQY